MSIQWKQQAERSNKKMLSVLAWLALHVGRGPIRLFLYPVVSYFFLTGGAARTASRDYLRKVLAREPTLVEQFRHFYVFAVVSIDRLFFLSDRYDDYQVNFFGQDVIQQYTGKETGCLLLVSHVGSVDVMRVYGTNEHKLPIRILMDREHNPDVVALLETLNPDLAGRVLDSGCSAPELALLMEASLRNGDLIGIMADRPSVGEQIHSCEFLGEKAAFPTSLWSLALVLKVPVILCFALYKGGNHYDVYFELMEEQPLAPRKQRQQAVAGYVEKYASRMEHHVRLAPYNWFNFYNFWHYESSSDN